MFVQKYGKIYELNHKVIIIVKIHNIAKINGINNHISIL